MGDVIPGDVVRKKLGEKKWIKLEEFLRDLKFGSITLIVQDGKVIQIEKNEKVRIEE